MAGISSPSRKLSHPHLQLRQILVVPATKWPRLDSSVLAPRASSAEQRDHFIACANESRSFPANVQQLNAEQKKTARALAAVLFIEAERGQIIHVAHGQRVIVKSWW